MIALYRLGVSNLRDCGVMGAGWVELLLPEDRQPRALVAELRARFDLVDRAATKSDRTYIDTFDGRLHERGWRLYTDGNGAPRVDHNGREVSAADVDRVVAPRALQPCARVRTSVRQFNVVNRERKTVARIDVLEPVAVGAHRRSVPLRPRVVVHEVRGYGGAFARTRAVLTGELGLVPTDTDLFETAMMALGRPIGGVSSALALKLDPDEPAAAAVAAVFARLTTIIEANLPGVLDDIDIEFLHDLRVAVRKARSLVKQLAAAIPADTVGHLRTELRWLQQVTGPTRDLDVHIVDLAAERARLPALPAAHLERVAATIAARRKTEYRKMARALRSDRFARLRADGGAVAVSGFGPDSGPTGALPISTVAGRRVAKLYGRMV